MSSELDPKKAMEVVGRARAIAMRHHHEYVTLEHLLGSIMQDQRVLEVLNELDADAAEISSDLVTHFKSKSMGDTHGQVESRITLSVQRVVNRVVTQVMFSGGSEIRPVDILIGLLEEDDANSHAVYFLAKQDLDLLEVKSVVSHGPEKDGDEDEEDAAEGEAEVGEDGEKLAGLRKSRAEKFLEKYCFNLNEQASGGRIDPLIGRENEVASLILTTARRTKNNSVVVGEPGVGKTAVVEGLAKMIVEEQVPDAIKGTIVYSLDIGALMAGTKYRGDMEERVKGVLDSLEKVAKDKGITPILFIDEIHTIMGTGSGGGGLDVANLLKPALAKGKLRCIGGTTYEEYRKHFEKDRALLRRFQRLDVNEPSPEDAKRILAGLSAVYAEYHGITYDQAALEAAVDLTHRYVTDRMLPDKAIDVIDAAGARQKIAPEEERQASITVGMIEVEVSKMAKIPARTVREDETHKLAHLDADLHKVVFGQDKAIEVVVDTVLLSRAGLRDHNKPQGNYLFAGPTGVGKTELSKQLAETMSMPLHRFDMSEYMEKHSVSKFIGSPPGYVGFGDGQAGSGLLTNAVEQTPHCVLLIDEVEKAHPDIFNIFLQIMDNGQLTNSAGKTINFRNVILIMTTNAGATELQKNSIGFSDSGVEGNDDKVIESTFAPEFRARLDAIVKFRGLQSSSMSSIVNKFVERLNGQAREKGVTIVLSDEARDYLARKGYSPKMGARPLASLIQNEVGKPLSRLMLFGDLSRGGEVVVKVEEDKLVLHATAAVIPAPQPVVEEVPPAPVVEAQPEEA
jgi:ATP-dependent Clp protease ATP-binding subunit ClpA